MPRRFTVLFVILFILGCCASAKAGDSAWYLQGNIGKDLGDGATSDGLAGTTDPPSGETRDLNYSDVTTYGVSGGYRFSDLVRADVSYTRLKGHQSWIGTESGVDSEFEATRTSDVLLVNVYLHARGLAPDTFAAIDPYVGLGVGFSYNRLHEITESVGPGLSDYDVENGNVFNPAARLEVGVDYALSRSLTLNMALDGYYLGGFKTGDYRDSAWASTPISPWKTKNAHLVSGTLGLRYSF